MKVLVQRVSRAEVRVGSRVVGEIGHGLLVLLGVERDDTRELTTWYARRLASMKFFPDTERGHWRRTVAEVGGSVLVVSQFTLAAHTRKGRRPSFDPAASPELATALYRLFLERLEEQGLVTAEGEFGAKMEVELVGDGPVTFLLEGPAPSRPAGVSGR